MAVVDRRQRRDGISVTAGTVKTADQPEEDRRQTEYVQRREGRGTLMSHFNLARSIATLPSGVLETSGPLGLVGLGGAAD